MRAVVYDRYGPPEVLRVTEVPDPRPRAREVLVRVHAVAVTSADARIRAARFPRGFGIPARLVFGILRPRRRILGSAFSGVVEAIGPRATDVEGAGLSVGDEVSGMTGLGLGGYAEKLAVRADRVVPKPAGVTHEEAAGLLFGGSTALYFLRDLGGLTAGQRVLVVGASGAIGTTAVQLARLAGAEVTAVTSGANAALVTDLGATRVIDHTTTAVTGDPDPDQPEGYDLVLDTVGVLDPAQTRRLLAPGGTGLLAAADLGQTLRARGDVRTGTSPERAEDFAHLLGLAERGDLRVVLSGTHPLADAAAAHAVVDSGRKVGNVVLSLS
ncbi:NAD(P)-dependent alcohol dehydrogenase [Nocardioides limicola]|uniref:NAD(P)-dependent alcohol dehydrogenase n=1 Tax=Nocardioides limicola TaxID=2803368 RepID=UPI00193C7F97|nr:NAD(P)-dependent alcohol dehydrogenase [Nocardioides sp. DJM-14]